MFDKNKYIEVDVISSETNTLGKFLFSEEPVVSQGTTAFDILKLEDNLDRILQKFPLPEQQNSIRSKNNQTQAGEIPLSVGTKLLIPKDKLNISFLVGQSNILLREGSVLAFVSSQLQRLQKDKRYQVEHLSFDKVNSITELLPYQNVWLWSRSLSKNLGGELEGQLIDLSPFMQYLDFGVDGNGGNFSLKLPPIAVESNSVGEWEPLSNISLFFSFGKGSQKEYLSQNSTHRKNLKGEWEQVQYLFNNIISKGDLIFIRTEKLEMESSRSFSPNLQIPSSSLSGQIYDMIGVIDECSLDTESSSLGNSIKVSGRDLMKLLIDDGSYFFPLEFARGIFQQAGSQYNSYSLVQRSFVSGKSLSLFAFTERSITLSLQFILNQLSYIKLVPDSLFSSYGDRRSSRFKLDDTSDSVGTELTKGIWQIVKLVFDSKDPFISKRRVVDSSISEEQGSLLNSIRKICQPDFVEFYGDTYGDQYYFVVRTPPFNKELFLSLLQGDVSSEATTIDVGFGPQLVPNLIGTQTINSVIDIEDESVLSDNLSWETEGCYSWYRLDPKASFLGSGSQITLGFLPAIFFPELGEIYGNSPLQVITNYIDYNAYQDSSKSISLENLESSIIRDLKFLVDTNIYRPFTRKGSIKIRPDRRFKRGTLVRYKTTGEIFYVDGVRNTRSYGDSVDGSTVLQVSRGMVERFVLGQTLELDGERLEVSYFNIANTTIGNFTPSPNSNPYESVLGAWKINKKILNFFLTRSQFKDVYKR